MRYLFFITLLISSSLFAAPNASTRIDRLEDQMQESRMQTVYGNYGANTATGAPLLNTYGGFASLEILGLQFFEGGTDYAFTNKPKTDSTTIGSLNYLNFDWRAAFRIQLGDHLKNPDFIIWTEYMRFATEQTANLNGPQASNIEPANLYPFAIIENASFKSAVDFNTIDLNLGRSYFLRPWFSSTSFAGLRAAWISQRTKALIQFLGFHDTMYQQNNYSGIGIRTGSQARWYLNKNVNECGSFSLFGSFAGSLMWGHFDNGVKLSQSFLTAINYTDDIDLVTPNMTLDIGISWERKLADCGTCIHLSLGYEFDYWWRQNQMIQFDADSEYTYRRLSEDLGLQGVKFNIAFDF